ncbi:MAG: hypothetical protein ACOZB3_05740 [Calditrichota bacterium]
MIEVQNPEKLPVQEPGPLGEGWVSSSENSLMNHEPKADAKSNETEEWSTSLQEGWNHGK